MYWLGSKYGITRSMIVAAVGILGLALKGKVFSNRKIYKSEKYATIHTYKQKAN
jgi:hypothetical protein